MKKKFIFIIFILIIIVSSILSFFIIRKNIVTKKFNNVLEMWRSSSNMYYSETNMKTQEVRKLYHLNYNELSIEKIEEDIKESGYYTRYKYIYDGENNDKKKVLFYKVKNDEISNDSLYEAELKSDTEYNKGLSSSDYIFNMLMNYLKTNEKIDTVKSGEFNGKKCYILNIFNHNEIIYIDKETYYPIGIELKHRTYSCELKFDCVKEEDIRIPDLSGYTIEVKE